MEEYSGRRSKTETAFLRRGSRFSSSNQSPEERTNHSSDKPRSSTRLNPVKATIANNQEGPRYLHDSFKSSSSMMAPASSSKFPLRKFEERRRQPLLPGIDIAETSRRNSEARQLEGSKKVIVDNKSSENPHREPEGFATEQIPYPECSHFTGPSGVSAHVVESSRTQRQKDKEVNLGTPGASSSTFTNRSTIPGNSTIGGRPPSGHVSGVQRRGLKNLGCSSVPDSHPPGCSSEPVIGRRFEIMRKRASDQESSSRPRSSSSGHPPPTDIRDTGPRIGTNVQLLPQQIIRRRSRNHQESAVSVRTRRSPHSARLCVPDERVDGMLSLHESFIRNGQSAQENLSFEASAESSTRPFSVGLPHDIYSSSRRGSSNTRAERVRPSSRFEESPTQLFHGLMGQRDGHRRMTMEGITEVLAALERIEQEAELTYEQLLVLDSTLFLRAFVSHDQHRDMRMDIDNMSYEELLALEERIGSVSTALSEEQIAKCLRRSMYSQVAKEGNKSIGVDMKCSICQEEYVEGEEVGRLPCDHQYHVCCIGQWLGQKNWCPVCKASAAPPSLG